MTDKTAREGSDDGPAENGQASDRDEREALTAVEPERDHAPAGNAETAELRAELDTLNDRHLRLAAEFENYRKRNERDRQLMAVRLQADLLAPLVEVLDDLERVEHPGTGATVDSVVDGVRLVEKKFRALIDAAGVEIIDPVGEEFDPGTMEALVAAPTDDPAQDHRVADVFQRGYRLGDVLIRPARVRVLRYEEPSGDGVA